MNFRIYISIATVSLLLVGTGCKQVLDVNDSPNDAASAPVDNVLNAAFTSHILSMEGEDARLACMWSQQFFGADRQYSSYYQYIINAEVFEWDKHYFGTCEQAEQVINLAGPSNNELYMGIAKVLQAQSYGTCAALYGDVPFSEANQFPEITDPVFDAQADVYAGVQTLLDEAVAHFQSGNGADAAGVDFFLGGSASDWLAAAQTLKARYYTHTGNYASAITAANARDAAALDWEIPHPGGYNQGMNIYNSFGQSDRFGYMTAANAHLPSILDTANTMYRGNANTDESARFADLFEQSQGYYDLNYNGSLFGEFSSFPLVTSLENQLILAEAHARSGSDADALTALNAARAILQAKYPTGTYAAYALTDFDVGGIADKGQGSTSANLLYEIVEEKYCSMVGQIEVFNDFRRTDNLLGLTPVAGSQFPQRFLLPQVEINANENAPDPIPDLYDATPVNN